MNFCCIRDFIINTKLQRSEPFSSKQIKIKHVKKKLFSMTSERKLSCTTSCETQFLQNFTKKKFMISSTQKTNTTPNKSPIINPVAPPKSPSSQNQPPNVSLKEGLMQDMNIDLESPFEGNAIYMVLTEENQLASEDQTS